MALSGLQQSKKSFGLLFFLFFSMTIVIGDKPLTLKSTSGSFDWFKKKKEADNSNFHPLNS